MVQNGPEEVSATVGGSPASSTTMYGGTSIPLRRQLVGIRHSWFNCLHRWSLMLVIYTQWGALGA